MKSSWFGWVATVGLMGWLAAGASLLRGQPMELADPNGSRPPPAEMPPSATPLDRWPQDGVLLLRNGEVLQGKIAEVGDFYYVAVPNGQVRIRAADVETACRTLQEGYRFKRQNIRLPSAQEHLRLGQWCLRHGLVDEAQQELAEAVRLQPDHPLLPLLRRRIEMAHQAKDTASPTSTAASSPREGSEVENWVRSLPSGVVEQFSQSVQPILLNNCTASGCHGPAEQNRFSLLKPPTGQLATRRLTQRNLASTFQWINPKDPLRSPLLTVPRAPHGSAKTAIFGNPHSEAYQRLVRWVLLAASVGPASDALVKVEHVEHSGDSTAPDKTPLPNSLPTSPACFNEHNEQKFQGTVIPAVPMAQQPHLVQQAGVWQPVPGALPSKGPLMEALPTPPNAFRQGSSIPSAFLPWAAANGAAMPPAEGSAAISPSFPLAVRSGFCSPQRSEPKQGDPTAGQFRPVDPFDPELFNRRHHPAEPTP